MLSVAQMQSLVLEAPFASLAILLLSFYVLVLSKKSPTVRYARPASTLPILGDTLDAAIYQVDRIYDWLAEQSEAIGGPWALSILGDPPNLIITSPELIEDVLKTQFEIFQRGDQDTDCMKELFGKGIFASGGDAWYFHRKTASNLFTGQMMRDVMYRAVHDNATILCDVLKVYASRDPGTMSFKSVITQFTSDVFCKIGFGVDLKCLEAGVNGEKGNEFVDALGNAMHVTFMRYQQPAWLWHLKRYLNIGDEKLHRHSIDVINKFIFRIIDESTARKQSEDGQAAPPKDLVSLFLHSKVNESEGIKSKAFDSEVQMIRDMVVNFLVAGEDTTANSISYFIVMMNRYPHVLAKIRDEMREHVPGLLSGEQVVPSMDELPRLTYLEAAIRENLRLNPVVPWVSRQAKAATVLCDGTPIPYNTRIGMLVYATGRSKSSWGEDALEFKPERWLDPDTGKLIVVSPYKFPTFIAGPRQCLGMTFALMQMKCTLAVLLSKFDLQTVQDPWEVTYKAALTMAVKGPMMVKVTPLSGGGEPARSA